MSVVLAVEPDSSQAEALRKAVRRVDAEFMLVSTTHAAIAAMGKMGKCVPDLILVSALLSPRDEDALLAHLRSLEGSSHVQTLTIPLLRRGKASTKKVASLGRFRKKTAAPEPAGCDPAVFAEQISGYLAGAHEAQRQFAEVALARANHPPVVLAPSVQAFEVERRVEPEQPYIPEGLAAIEQPAAISQPIAPEAVEPSVFKPDAAWRESTFKRDAGAYESPFARRATGNDPVPPAPAADEFARWRTPSERPGGERPDPQPDDSAWIDVDVLDVNLDAGERAPQVEAARLEAPPTAEAVQSQLLAEIARFEEKAQQRREAELVRAQDEAQAHLTAEVERVQAEAETRRQLELARVHAEAEAQRHAAVTEARAAAESEARSALRSELEQVRLNEIARVQAEADERCDAAARQARETAQADAARSMAEELARIRAQVEQTLNSQLAQARAEAEEMREAEMARAQAEAAALRDAAARDARLAAEATASRALEAEVARVRTDAEARLRIELDTIRREAEHLRRADQSEANQAAEKVRAAAVREARASAEAANKTLEAELLRVRAEADARLEAEVAKTRNQAERQRATDQAAEKVHAAAVRDARAVAEAANQTLEAELLRVRAEADARLEAEVAKTRNLAERQRATDEAAEKVRAAAVRDAHAIAEAAKQTLEAELLRVRAEADARLEADVVTARNQAERQRATELEEIRTQVAGMRETAAQQARRAAAHAIASEVVRGAGEDEVEPMAMAITRTIRPVESRPARLVEAQPAHPVKPQAPTTAAVKPPATSASDYYSLWKPADPVAKLPPDDGNPDSPKTVVALIHSKWALPVAAALLLVVGSGISVGWSWRPRSSNPAPAHAAVPVRHAVAPVASEVTVKTGGLSVETNPPGVRVLIDGTVTGRTPLRIAKLKPGKYMLVLESNTGTVARTVVVRAGETAHVTEGIFSGWLAVFAGVPLNISVGGHLRGTTEDGQLMMPAGSYDVELVSARFNYRETKHVTIEPGTVTSYTVSLPTSVIRINGPDGTDISIDGHATGRTPLGDLAVPIGTHEVVGTSAELGQVRRSIEVKIGEPAEVTLK